MDGIFHFTLTRVVPFSRPCTLTLGWVDGVGAFPYTEFRVGVVVGRGGLPSFSDSEQVTGRSNQSFAGLVLRQNT